MAESYTNPTARYRFQMPSAFGVRDILAAGVAEKWRFLAVMPEIDAQIGSNYTFDPRGGGVAYSSQAMRLKKPQIPIAVAESLDIPPIQIDTDQRYGQGTSINVPRKLSKSNLTINFYEDQRYNVSKYLWAWKSLISDRYNLYNAPVKYKKTIQVWAFNSVSNYAPEFMTIFTECFPTTFVGGLSYGQDNGFLTVSTEFTVDGQDYSFTN